LDTNVLDADIAPNSTADAGSIGGREDTSKRLQFNSGNANVEI